VQPCFAIFHCWSRALTAEQHRLAFDLRAVAQQVEYGRPIDGTVFDEHACRLGAQGIVSKCLGSKYVSGRCDAWRKCKNPQAPAVRLS